MSSKSKIIKLFCGFQKSKHEIGNLRVHFKKNKVKRKKGFHITNSCNDCSVTGCTSTSNTRSRTPPSYPPCSPGPNLPGHPAVLCFDTEFAYIYIEHSALHHWDRCRIKDGWWGSEEAVHFFQNVTIATSQAFSGFRDSVPKSCD